MQRNTFVTAKAAGEEQGVRSVFSVPVVTKSFVVPVSDYEYGKRMRAAGHEVYHCASAEMERGWQQGM